MRLDFRLMGEERSLSLAELNDIFDFTHHDQRTEYGEFILKDYWGEISGHEYTHGYNHAKYITDPALRYIHRLMSHSIFGRGANNSRVTRQEVFFMWCMQRGRPINTGVWLLAHFRQMAKAKTGKIVGAGLITQIAIHFGFDMAQSGLVPDGSAGLIDLHMCRQTGLAAPEAGVWYLLTTDGRRVARRDSDSEGEDIEMGQPDDPDAESEDDDSDAEDDEEPLPDFVPDAQQPDFAPDAPQPDLVPDAPPPDFIPDAPLPDVVQRSPLPEFIPQATQFAPPVPPFPAAPAPPQFGSASSSTAPPPPAPATIDTVLWRLQLMHTSNEQWQTDMTSRMEQWQAATTTQLQTMAASMQELHSTVSQMHTTFDGRLRIIEDLFRVDSPPPPPPPPS